MRRLFLPPRLGHRARRALPALLGMFALCNAGAQAATATFQVTATVVKACVMTTPATLAFGSYNPSNPTALGANSTFTVICTYGTPYSLGMSAGISAGASITKRSMTSPTAASTNNLLGYGLFKDSGYGTNWDNSVTGTGYLATGLLQTYTIYGAIPIGQYTAAPATDYADTVTLTLTY